MSRSNVGLIPLFLVVILIGSACEGGDEDQVEWPDPESCSAPPGTGEGSKKKARRIRSFFEKKKRSGHFNGTVLFAENGRILFEEAIGYRNRRTGDSLRLRDPFQLASVSKPLTATLILQLYEEGMLELEDSLSKYFEAWPYEGITVEMLLSHRSGLPNYMYFMDGWKKGAKYNNEDVLRRMKKDRPDVYYIPDHRYNYCNSNYCLLALIAERAADTSFKAALEERVYSPARMGKSDPLSLIPKKAKVKGHNKWGSPLVDYPNRSIGDKGLYASIRDLYRFDRSLRNGRILEDSTLKKAYTPQHEDLYQHDNYGLGWRIDQEDPEDRIIWSLFEQTPSDPAFGPGP